MMVQVSLEQINLLKNPAVTVEQLSKTKLFKNLKEELQNTHSIWKMSEKWMGEYIPERDGPLSLW